MEDRSQLKVVCPHSPLQAPRPLIFQGPFGYYKDNLENAKHYEDYGIVTKLCFSYDGKEIVMGIKDNVESETPPLPRGDLYPAGILE